jgi:hypothetical protein
LHLLAIQAILPNIFGNNFHTLWFVSVLFVCYGCFLLSRNFLGRLRIFLLVSLSIFLIVILLRTAGVRLGLELFQVDFEVWISLFMLGMMYARNDIAMLLFSKRYLLNSFLTVVAVFSLLALIYYSIPFLLGLRRILDLSLSVPLLAFSYVLILQTHFILDVSVARAIKWVSGVSYFVFLLHRPIWSVMVLIWPERSFMQALFVLGVGLPMIFLSSYIMQSFHISMLKAIGKRVNP